MGNARKAKGAELSFSDVSVRWGCAGAFARRVSSRPKGTGARPFPCPGKQKPGVGTRPERIACVRGKAKKKTGCATCSAQPRGRARHGEERDTVRDLLAAGALEKPRSRAQLFRRFCALGMRRGFRPAGFLPAEGNRRQAFSLPGKTGARRGPAPGNNRVRARRGEGTNTVRELPTAGAQPRR